MCVFLPNESEVEETKGVSTSGKHPSFAEFTKIHNKNYASEGEKAMRLDVYQSNLKKIDGLNAKKLHGVDYGATRFTDQTQDEFLRSHTGLRIDPKYKAKNSLLGLNLAVGGKKSTMKKRTKKGNAASQNLQEISDGYFDWREISVAYPSIDDQKKCGVCWAFASAGALQVLASYNADEEIKLSKQRKYDNPQKLGCSGDSSIKGVATGFGFVGARGATPGFGSLVVRRRPETTINGICYPPEVLLDRKSKILISTRREMCPNRKLDSTGNRPDRKCVPAQNLVALAWRTTNFNTNISLIFLKKSQKFDISD
ncbi:unnamed protein product [Bemisia tabaci]|uniref:Cathepsin propeptide inhibitor domain-containing protein n=1 Tax=Bemisia tabaci TaxID=7038 RepID=A0A9P0AQ28_BEMTA|nr:unnamed protein product [Bemisia tabaci]